MPHNEGTSVATSVNVSIVEILLWNVYNISLCFTHLEPGPQHYS